MILGSVTYLTGKWEKQYYICLLPWYSSYPIYSWVDQMKHYYSIYIYTHSPYSIGHIINIAILHDTVFIQVQHYYLTTSTSIIIVQYIHLYFIDIIFQILTNIQLACISNIVSNSINRSSTFVNRIYHHQKSLIIKHNITISIHSYDLYFPYSWGPSIPTVVPKKRPQMRSRGGGQVHPYPGGGINEIRSFLRGSAARGKARKFSSGDQLLLEDLPDIGVVSWERQDIVLFFLN